MMMMMMMKVVVVVVGLKEATKQDSVARSTVPSFLHHPPDW